MFVHNVSSPKAKLCLNKQKSQYDFCDQKHKNMSNVKGEIETKLMSALLTGVNRAFPYAALEPTQLDQQLGKRQTVGKTFISFGEWGSLSRNPVQVVLPRGLFF